MPGTVIRDIIFVGKILRSSAAANWDVGIESLLLGRVGPREWASETMSERGRTLQIADCKPRSPWPVLVGQLYADSHG